MDKCSAKYEFYAIVKYERLIYFAYSSWDWVYETFKGELSRMFSYDGKSQRARNLWEHFGNANMDLSICQGNASSLEEKCTEQEDLNPRKAFQL